MAKMPVPGHDHGESGFIRCLDHFIIAHRATWLDNCRGSRLGGGQQTVSKGEEGIGGDN